MDSFGRTIGDHPGVLQTALYPQHPVFPPTLDVTHGFLWNGITLPAAAEAGVFDEIGDGLTRQGLLPSSLNQVGPTGGAPFYPYAVSDPYEFQATDIHSTRRQSQESLYASTALNHLSPSSVDTSSNRFTNLQKRERDRRAALASKKLRAAVIYGRNVKRTSSDVSVAGNGRSDRSKVKKHRGLPCLEPDCSSTKGFRSRFELERHKKTQHHLEPIVGDQRLFKCAISGCRRSEAVWPRADKFRDHIRQDHPDVNAEQHIQSSTVAGSTEHDKGHITTESTSTVILPEPSCHYPTPPDSITGQALLGTNDSASNDNYTGHYNTTGSDTSRASVFGSRTRTPASHSNLAASAPESRDVATKDLALLPRWTSEDSGYIAAATSMHVAMFHSLGTEYVDGPNVFFASPSASFPMDAGGGYYEQQQTGQSFSKGTRSGTHAHPSHPSALGKRQGRDDDMPPDTPRDKKAHSTKSASDGRGFCCAFWENPRICRWKSHGKACHEYVSELKRFHNMHWLFYCGMCFDEFPTEAEWTTHERAPCTKYRCFVSGCPNERQIVESSCAQHGRKNSQSGIYQYLRELARRFRDRQHPGFDSAALSPEASNGNLATPIRGMMSMSIAGQTSPSFSSAAAFSPDVSATRHREVATPSIQAGSSQDFQFVTPLQSVDCSERISSLENLICMMWRRLETDDLTVNGNLSSYYEENIPYGQQTSMQSNQESLSQYRARVLENLARQLWDELHGESHTDRNELRLRVYNRVPRLASQAEPHGPIQGLESSRRSASGNQNPTWGVPGMPQGQMSGPLGAASGDTPVIEPHAGTQPARGLAVERHEEPRNAFGDITSGEPFQSVEDHLLSDLGDLSAFSGPILTTAGSSVTTAYQSDDTKFDMSDYYDFRDTLPAFSADPWVAPGSIQPHSNFPPAPPLGRNTVPETAEDNVDGTDGSLYDVSGPPSPSDSAQ